ncbi:PspC domain-containing protein [Patescibacteria group bacterium]|jgi:phage shock protein PspC (stress-responsive transcriptional regulator)|nr:PspC domain-containing protein [Patescibacteria group bacterium]
MHKITSIHLNGKAYQLEEQAFEALQGYLAQAEAQLKEDPDKEEILSDLEHAIGDKCSGYLGPNKDVITKQEIDEIIRVMGPVHGANDASEAPKAKEQPKQAPKSLYLIREGAWIAGVCTGLAAFFDVDVTLVRAAFILMTVLTGGAGILVYVALMFVIPYATTGEQKAAAYGAPFTAQEIVKRVKDEVESAIEKSELKNWQEKWKGKKEEWQSQAQDWEKYKYHYQWEPKTPRPGASPVLGLMSALLALVWIAALLSLITTGAIFGWMVPAGIPLWLAIVLLFIVFHMITGPLRGAAQSPYYGGYSPWMAVVDTIGVIFIVIALGFAYTNVPEFHDFVNKIPEWIRQSIQPFIH